LSATSDSTTSRFDCPIAAAPWPRPCVISVRGWRSSGRRESTFYALTAVIASVGSDDQIIAMSHDDAPDYDGVMEAIELRWLLRDIRAKRWVLAPLDPVRVQRLVDMGLVEMVDDKPALTEAGRQMIEFT
jgi:hypothetical protein